MITVDRILVATDFGEASAAALEYGRALASSFGATLLVLHVTDDFALKLSAGTEDYAALAVEVQEDMERSAREQTQALLTDRDRQQLHATAVAIRSANTAAAIVNYAQANRIGLIVIGTHGRGRLQRLVMGSVAERVVRTAGCAVLTVHALPHASATSEPALANVADVH